MYFCTLCFYLTLYHKACIHVMTLLSQAYILWRYNPLSRWAMSFLTSRQARLCPSARLLSATPGCEWCCEDVSVFAWTALSGSVLFYALRVGHFITWLPFPLVGLSASINVTTVNSFCQKAVPVVWIVPTGRFPEVEARIRGNEGFDLGRVPHSVLWESCIILHSCQECL